MFCKTMGGLDLAKNPSYLDLNVFTMFYFLISINYHI